MAADPVARPWGDARTAGYVLAALASTTAAAAAALWFESVGANWLPWIIGAAGGLALAWLAKHLLYNGKLIGAAIGAWYVLTLGLPGAALADDLVLGARGVAQPATVVGFVHVSGPHVARTHTRLRLGQGVVVPGETPAETRIDGDGGLRVGQRVTVVVDPTGRVDSRLAEDVHTGRNATLFGIGLAGSAIALCWWIALAERDRRRDAAATVAAEH